MTFSVSPMTANRGGDEADGDGAAEAGAEAAAGDLADDIAVGVGDLGAFARGGAF